MTGNIRVCNLTAFTHSSIGPVVHPFASCHEGPRFNSQGILLWNGDFPVSVVSLHWWPRCDWSLRPHLRWALSLHADNVIISLDLTQLFCTGFTLAADSPSGFTTTYSVAVGGGGGDLWRACNLTVPHTAPMVQWSTHLLPMMRDPGSISREILMSNQDSLVSVVCYSWILYFVFHKYHLNNINIGTGLLPFKSKILKIYIDSIHKQ